VSYDVTPAPAGVDPEKWALHERGACGGYYKCGFCATNVAAEKLRQELAFSGQRRRLRPATQEELAADRRRMDARRAKAKNARRARKLQRRRAR
jgi:hypothetical protein